MSRIRQIGMAAGTFSVALGIGFVMQNGDALASRFGNDEAPEQPAPFSEAIQQETAVSPDIATETPLVEEDPIAVAQGSVITSETPEFSKPETTVAAAVVLPEAAKVPVVQEAPVQLAALETETVPTIEESATVEVDCVPVMDAAVGPIASVTLSVSAPCHASSAFTVHHQGMMFTAMTDDTGTAELSVPALAEVAVVIAAFEGGDGAVATTTVPDFTNYDRAVLQWQGDESVMLSAYEGDAVFGDENHIHMTNPGDANRVETATGGYLIRLGEDSVEKALMAEVYTFPSGMMGSDFEVTLVAEAEITAGNCGQELTAQSLQVSPTGQTSALDLTMIMPECDAVGDFLILQNMFEDLTLASK
ncbi:translocase [Octadecabacter ascidiaceicola]|uniref:Translocase n=1 Tax=Octadecabacter ascidiaceicola TaxID=1655543 RepID=A0A238KFG4_9RHOB|nr:translocase [Octadecabacter ascidiaceicola]SMX41357.1 hypothetical protein OCA8868_02488 [Octadecabacter ascidiaceicola]